MTMGVIVYYAEISGSKEVKKRQQRVMMILESKTIPYEAIDITEPGKENDKEFMMKNGKIRGDVKYVQSPQIFNGEIYCGDYEDFDLANENDVLEEFLNTPKIDRSSPQKNGKIENGSVGASREGSSEPKIERDVINTTLVTEPETVAYVDPVSITPPPAPSEEVVAETEISSITENVNESLVQNVDNYKNVENKNDKNVENENDKNVENENDKNVDNENDKNVDNEDEEEEKSQIDK